jgi:two-component system, LytTR family, response regulator
MTALRVMVVEDHPLARERLVRMLTGEPDVEVVAECEHGAEALARIPQVSPDLVFLDVQMPEMNGFDVIEAIGVEAMPPVVFVTAFDSYALKAFEVHAFDYLLKPFGPARLSAVVARARQQIRGSRAPAPRLNDLLAAPEIAGRRDRLVLRSGGRIVFVLRDDVEWVEAAGNYVRFHAANGTIQIRDRMSAVEERLGDGFARIHRSTVVNLRLVVELQVAGGGEYDVLLKSGERLRVTRLHRPALEQQLRRL